MITINNKVPDFTANATSNKEITLSAFKGKNIILYFYPKDSTPGCTTEGQDFTSLYNQFTELDTVIFGVSRDSIASHEKFKAKYNFTFDLLSDPEEKLCKLFDVIKQKSLYGKQYMGIERSTFLIDKAGILKQEWRKVKVKKHAEAVLSEVRLLNA
ncbi:MAG: peroxiredoxin [Endozoicomonadaceae bacterium]|nr:peroxiredoxin [Endozoicomonadaceae bacterium]MCY4330786.1 peroxiredoxin [Endozoicomonadaceae bacterium]